MNMHDFILGLQAGVDITLVIWIIVEIYCYRHS